MAFSVSLQDAAFPEALLFQGERGFLGVVLGARLPLEPLGYRAAEVPARVESAPWPRPRLQRRPHGSPGVAPSGGARLPG